MNKITPFILICFLFSCQKEETPTTISEAYFPPTDGSAWDTASSEELEWDEAKLEELYDYLESNATRGFIIIKDGKIASEKYWGTNFLNDEDFDENSSWYWASAAKSLTATLVGIAQEEGMLNISDKTSDYLGTGWTSLPTEKENLIQIKHQLSMTTGLDYTVDNIDCTDVSCLSYGKDAGTQWFYHNAPYTLLGDVINNAADEDLNAFTDSRIGSKIGMNGLWIKQDYLNLYLSTLHDAARFGLLILNHGKWGDTEVISDTEYLTEMTNGSQEINPSYGYLWWLNGKNSIVYPGLEQSFNLSLAPNAPSDMICALGKNGQFIDIVPSLNLVVVRMGEAPDDSLVPLAFHNEMWDKILEVIQ